MKRMMMLLTVVSLVSSMSMAAVVWQNDCSTLAGWGESSNAANEPGDATGGIRVQDWGFKVYQMNSWWDGAGYTNIWSNTGVTIEANKDYTLTLRMVSFANSTPVTVSLQDTANGWTNFLQQSVSPAPDWADNTVFFSTKNGANAGVVGGVIGIGIAPGWWNNLAIDNMSLDVVPEPASLLLLGLGSLAALKRKK